MIMLIRKIAVVGAGTMGAAIAAHLANASVPVTLLDIVPKELTGEQKKKGLKLSDSTVRNSIAQGGLERALKSRPASFVSDRHADLVQIGNIEDDLAAAAEADWVIEAVIENLKIKQDLMARLDDLRGEHTIISTNTSGIPVGEVAEGRSKAFRRHFLGTHFFNPPRYVELLELIPLPETDPAILESITDFGERRLGKGIVRCKDRPNFIANRYGSVTGAFALDYALEHGYNVPEVDALSGPLVGRPKTAVFRLLDLVGLDVAEHVRANLAKAIPEDAVAQEVLASEAANALSAKMVDQGWLGNKAKVGFYKEERVDGAKEFWPLNLETLEHHAPGEKPRFDSVGKAQDIEDLVERLKSLLAGDDRAADWVRANLYFGLAYASHIVPEAAELPAAVDDAVRWGFRHELGPFELWQQLGVAETVKAMVGAGFPPAEWVTEMLKADEAGFYRFKAGEKAAVYDPAAGDFVALPRSRRSLSLQASKTGGGVVAENAGASLIDLGDGIACLEFHTKMNALDADILGMAEVALEKVEKEFAGLVLGSEAENFSAGANLFFVAMAAQSEQWDDLEGAIRALQDLNMRMRYFPRPLVAAPAGLTLGGGAEISMHAPRVVAAMETYMGLVETGVGLIPAGGGSKEMLRRVLNPMMRVEQAEALPGLERIFTQVGQAKVATSAEEALQMGMLDEADRVVMNRRHLLHEAKREALHLAENGYAPPLPEKVYAAGRDALAALRIGLYLYLEGGQISEHDRRVGEKLAYVLCGGELSQPAWVNEQYFLDLEREAFLSLCGEPLTQARIWHTLETGRPLRN